MEDQNLYKDFKPTSKESWKKKILKDLALDDLNSLTWETEEGISIQPFYTLEDVEGQNLTALTFNTANKFGTDPRFWENLEKITVTNAETANKKALESLEGGADGIIFDIPTIDISLKILLNDILLNHCIVYVQGRENILKEYLSYIEDMNYEKESIRGGFLDPYNTKVDASQFQKLFKNTLHIPYFKPFTIIGQTTGKTSNAISELTSIVHQLASLLKTMIDNGLSPEKALSKTIIISGVSTLYFKEIAKLRALRLLIKGIAMAYNIEGFDPSSVHLLVETSLKANSTSQNNYTDMIRNTTQAMAAILGGCNAISVQPHEASVEEGYFASRIARNISLILKEEAYFNKVMDPSAGSYYIETLTNTFFEEAWKTFLIEKR